MNKNISIQKFIKNIPNIEKMFAHKKLNSLITNIEILIKNE